MAGQTITTEEAKKKSVDEIFEILSSGRDGLTRSEAGERVLTSGYMRSLRRKRARSSRS